MALCCVKIKKKKMETKCTWFTMDGWIMLPELWNFKLVLVCPHSTFLAAHNSQKSIYQPFQKIILVRRRPDQWRDVKRVLYSKNWPGWGSRICSYHRTSRKFKPLILGHYNMCSTKIRWINQEQPQLPCLLHNNN